MTTMEKFKAGDAYEDPKMKAKNFFADPAGIAADLIRDVKAIRNKYRPHELLPLIEDLLKNGEPLDDKKGTTEQLISILTTLPRESDTRTKLTNKLIDTLWNNLQHPPLSYVGGDVKYQVVDDSQKAQAPPNNVVEFDAPDGSCRLREEVPPPPNGMFQYRMPDGSHNNILNPNLGRAGTPYARSVRAEKKLHGRRPDPGLLFDMLMARGPNDFRENPAGISSVLFYHATIIIHDIFRTNLANRNISDTSSYLDLAPLYGSSLKDQLEIRTMKEGKLKPDTFHEKRLLGQPPGVNVMLVLYSRFHNYVADMLLKINEGDRFKLAVRPGASPGEMAKAVAKQDHDLFNTARLIVGGMYINISLHDYLRAITNTHHSNSDWTLDPRVEIGKSFDSEGTPRGVGNQVSVEFNLLYRFHACISKHDEKWLNEFFANEMFPGRKVETLGDISVKELVGALHAYEQKLDKDPSKRTFGGLQRGPDGRFNDQDLVNILNESMNDPAGCFGARMVPKALKAIEILGIVQGRKWQVASLNEFRQFFGLKRFNTFKDINGDEQISSVLEKLYDHPDMVEMYPGLMIESIKPAMNPGCGICPTYSVGRAILSDAITLVRSDRFNTIDYTVNNLTSWGYEEVKQDYKTLGGSMFYKLIQRGLPGWFPFNSINVMQPMFTGKMNAQIAKEIGTFNLYTMDGPKKPAALTVVTDYEGCKAVLDDYTKFAVPWGRQMNLMMPGEHDYSNFMLAGDRPANFAQKRLLGSTMASVPNLMRSIELMIANVGRKLLDAESFKMRDKLSQVDIVRDLAIPLDARLVGDLFYLDLQTDENPHGELSHAALYKHLTTIRGWVFENTDPAMSWNKRRMAAESAKVVTAASEELTQDLADARSGIGLVKFITDVLTSKPTSRTSSIQHGSLRSAGRQIVAKLLDTGLSVADVTDMLVFTAGGGAGSPVQAFVEVLELFLKPENTKLWADVQDMARRNDRAGLRKYVSEAQRLSSHVKTLRIATQPSILNGKPIAPGSPVVVAMGEAGRDAHEFDKAGEFKIEREQKALLSSFSGGMHACIGRELTMTYLTSLVKLVAELKNLRQAPGDMGVLKRVQNGASVDYLSDDWAYLTSFPTTWKLHFDGRGDGQFVRQHRSEEQKMAFHQVEAVIQKREESAAW